MSRQGAGSHGRSASRGQRVSYDEYLLATALTLARRHRPVWFWRNWRHACCCGVELLCRARHRVPVSRGHWPVGEVE
ncbi:hypothetical protein FXF52_17815 [Micromonospora sp. MP36]|nr:hypothetical protein FXF52_17815 [Micromonospora sp. MP36]